MDRLSIDVVENAAKTVNIMPETPLDKVVADCMKDYLEMRKAKDEGLLLRLPCKAGDTVWYIDDDDDDYPLELLVTKIEVEENDYLRYHAREKDNYGKIGFIKDDIGKSVFLTQEEAEQALKQKGE